MARPTKLELLHRFFPEVMNPAGSKGDKEAAMRVNTLACEAILADLLNLYDKGLDREGLGALCLRLQRGSQVSDYVPIDDFRADREMALRNQASDMESFLLDVIDQIERTDPKKAAIILLLDNSSAQLFQIGREYPARTIQALMEEHAG